MLYEILPIIIIGIVIVISIIYIKISFARIDKEWKKWKLLNDIDI